MIRTAVWVPTDALTRMLRLQGFTDEPHPVLAGTLSWTPADETTDDESRMWTAFDKAGLLDRRGQLGQDAGDTLTILARPGIEYIAWFHHRDQHRAVLVAAGRSSEIAIAYHDLDTATIELSSVRDQSLPEVLIRQLPQVGPAHVPAINLRLAELADNRDSDELFWQPSISTGGPAGTLRQLAERPLVGTGELYVGLRDHTGHPRRTTEPVYYQDIHQGRMHIVNRAGYVSIAPGTPQIIADKLREAERGLGDSPITNVRG